MSFRRIGVGFLAGLIGLGGCVFEPEIIEPSGYLFCSDTGGCPAGFSCVQGLCAPDCLDLKRIAWIEPGPMDHGLSSICTIQENTRECVAMSLDSDLKMVSVDLGPRQFLLFAQDPGEEASACERLVMHISMLGATSDQEVHLDMVLWGGMHVVGMNQLVLHKQSEPADSQERLKQFRQNTFFYAIDMNNLGWPLEVRYYPSQIDAQSALSSFSFREFELSCCVR